MNMANQTELTTPTVGDLLLERRRYPRTYVQMTLQGIRLDPDGGDVIEKLHMTDISRGGLGGLADNPFYPGQRVMVTLPHSSDATSRNMCTTVVRCRKEQDGYRVGLEFDSSAVGVWCGINGSAAA
jgi:hypothetical protein